MSAPSDQSANEAERIAALRLTRSAEIGPVTFQKLIERFGSATAAIEALPEFAGRDGRTGQIRLCSLADAKRELDAAAKLGARMLVRGMPGYPDLLDQTEGAPSVLFARGRAEALASPAIAIVGARNASANGRKLAEALAAGLGAHGFVVVSGLARGIDAAVHQGALSSGTIAVIAGGIDQVYPEQHVALYERICESGLVLSEMPFGHVARAVDFPRRNRIIAGLARGTVIVEAAERSGSLITARLAAEMNREVFAVPGSPLDARCRGTNGLLKDGAILVETVADILANLPAHASERVGPILKSRAIETSARGAEPRSAKIDRETANPEVSSLAERLMGLLGPSPTSIDDLVRLTGASAAEIQAALFDLEMEGLTLRHPGQAVSLAPEA